MHNLIKIVSYLIILLGIVHIGFAFPLYMNEGTLWFVGSGMAIIFAGLLNLVAIDRGGSKFTKVIAAITNAFNCIMFCFALPILNQPQVYVGIIIFLIPTIAFFVELSRRRTDWNALCSPWYNCYVIAYQDKKVKHHTFALWIISNCLNCPLLLK